MKIYTMGYGTKGWTPFVLKIKAIGLHARIVDIRFKPSSRNAAWRQRALRNSLGGYYIHIKGFGNENFRGGAIKLHNPDVGLEVIKQILDAQYAAILMCVCKNLETCHRLPVAELVAHHFGLSIEHLPPPAQPTMTGFQLLLF